MSTTDFQFYEGQSTEDSTVARITVRRGGLLVLTHSAVQMLGDDVTRVQVGYNPKTHAVGIRSADVGARGSYLLRKQAKSVSKLVDGKRVLAHHGLKVEKAQSFEAQDFGDGVIGFVLPEAEVEKPKAKAKK